MRDIPNFPERAKEPRMTEIAIYPSIGPPLAVSAVEELDLRHASNAGKMLLAKLIPFSAVKISSPSNKTEPVRAQKARLIAGLELFISFAIKVVISAAHGSSTIGCKSIAT